LAGDPEDGSIAFAIAADGGRCRALAFGEGFFELNGGTSQQYGVPIALLRVRNQDQRHFESAVFRGGNECARLVS